MSTLTLVKKLFAIAAAGAMTALFSSNAQASVLYNLDDGQSNISLGVSGGSGRYDLFWLNSFTAQPQGEVINSISLTWGTPTLSGRNVFPGMATEVLLYSDPNNDGNPIDAVLLTSATTAVANPNTDIFTNVAIAPTKVTGNFFIAALMRNLNFNTFPAALDTTSPVNNRSWVGFTTPGNSFNVNNLSGLFTTESVGFRGNWMLRAEGVSEAVSVPEPASVLGVLAFGAIGVASRKKRKQQQEG